MKLLLDTHALVWAAIEPARLSKRSRGAIEVGEVCVSVASLWELVVKDGKKNSLLDGNPVDFWDRYVVGAGTTVLNIRTDHVSALLGLPDLHKDPFDRILVAQSIVEEAALVTYDKALRRYPVHCIW